MVQYRNMSSNGHGAIGNWGEGKASGRWNEDSIADSPSIFVDPIEIHPEPSDSFRTKRKGRLKTIYR